MSDKPTEQEVMSVLKDGGTLRYFYLNGGVAVHGKDGNPSKDARYCPIDVFLKWQQDGTLTAGRQIDHGYPWYANNAKSQEYTLTHKLEA